MSAINPKQNSLFPNHPAPPGTSTHPSQITELAANAINPLVASSSSDLSSQLLVTETKVSGLSEDDYLDIIREWYRCKDKATFFRERPQIKELDRFELATRLSKGNGQTLVKVLDSFELTTPHKIEIIHALIEKDPVVVIENMEQLGVSDLMEKEELVRRCLQSNVGKTMQNLELFHIDNEQELLNLALFCAEIDTKNGGGHGLDFFHKFRIEKEENRLKVALQYARIIPAAVAAKISKFQLLERRNRYLIAEQCTKHGILAFHVDKFQFDDPQDRYKLVKLTFQNDSLGYTADNFDKFDIENENDRFELALEWVNSSEVIVRSVLRNISKFNLTPEHLLVIAKTTVDKYPQEICGNIESFQISDEKERFEIALKSALIHPYALLQNIHNFKLDQSCHFDLGALCLHHAKNAPLENSIPDVISNLKLTQEEQFLLLLLCSRQYPIAITKLVKQFNIPDEQRRLVLARLLAEADGRMIVLWIENFTFSNPQDIEKLLNEGVSTVFFSLFNLETFSLDPFDKLLLDHLVHKSEFFRKSALVPFLRAYSNNSQSTEELATLLANYLKESFPDDPMMQEYLEMIMTMKVYPKIRKELLGWLSICAFFIAQLPADHYEKVKESRIIERLINVRSPALRLMLSKDFFQLSRSLVAWDLYSTLTFLKIEASLLRNSGVSQEITEMLTNNIPGDYKKDDRNMRKLLEALHLMNERSTLSGETKGRVIQRFSKLPEKETQAQSAQLSSQYNRAMKLWQEQSKSGVEAGPKPIKPENYKNKISKWGKSYDDQVKALITIMAFDKEKVLEDSTSTTEACKQILIDALGLPDNDETISRFYAEFMHERLKNMFPIFAAKLQKLNDPLVTRDLIKLTNCVIDGKFKETRSNIDENEHMMRMKQNHPEVYEKWMSLSNFEHRIKPRKVSLQASFDPHQWLRQKLISDNHLDESHRRRFTALVNPVEGETINESSSSSEGNTIDDLLVKLYHEQNRDDQITLLKEIHKQLPTDSLFYHDVNGMLDVLEGKIQNSDIVKKVVIANEPLDYLCMGIEVIGSCQQLDQSADTTKGIFSYVLDPKNNFLMVKDKNGRIVIRAKISLLNPDTKPVLYIERTYTNGSPIAKACQEGLEEAAIKISDYLGVPLAGGDDDGWHVQKRMKTILKSIGNGLSFEYSDASYMGGVSAGGIYSIAKAWLIHKPSKK
jgi:hypothetical protein